MAWNGSKGASAPQQKTSSGARANLKGALAGLIVVLCAGAAIYFLLPASAPAPTAPVPQEEEAPKVIEEVKPQVVTNAAPQIEEAKGPNFETYRDDRGVLRYKIGNGRAPDPNLKTSKNTPTRDKNGNKRFGSKFTIFETRSENEIARMIAMPLGGQMFGSRRYDEKFEQDFLESCKVPIVIEPGDSDYVKNLKTAMNETKIEIRNRMAAGEKLADILTETRKELERLAVYRREMKQQTIDALQSGVLSDDEANAVVDAANRLLAEKGLSPIPRTTIIRNHIKIVDGNF